MPLNKVGFNASGVQGITAPDFNISSNVTQFVNDIPAKANEYTGGWVGTGIMLALVSYLYYKLNDKSELAISKYSQIRTLGLSTGITGVVGLVMYTIGYFTKLYPVIFFLVLFMIFFAWVIKEERS